MLIIYTHIVQEWSIPSRALQKQRPLRKLVVQQQETILLRGIALHKAMQSQAVSVYFVSISLIYFHQYRFRNLSPSQKIAATAIRNSSFLQNLSYCLPLRTPTTSFNLQSRRCIETLMPTQDQYFQYLLGNLRVAWCSQPVIYLKEEVLEGHKFVEWLDKISNFKLLEYNCEGEDNLLWYSSKSFRPLSHSLVSQFQKQICRYFYNKIQFYHQVNQLQQFCVRNNKSSIVDTLDIPILRFLQINRKDLNKILEKIKIEEDKLHTMKAQQMFEQMEHLEKAKKSRKKGKKKVSNKQQVEHEQADQKVKQVEIQHTKQNEILKPQEKDQKILTYQTKVQLSQNQSSQFQVEVLSSPQKVQIEQITSQCLQDKAQIQKIECTCLQETQHSQQFTQENINDSQDIKQSKTKKKRKRKEKRQQQIQNFKKQICHKFMTRQLENIVQFINSQTNKILQARVMAFQRVRIFIQNTYPFSNAILFGSNAIGLSLPVSDVDILLIGFQCTTRTDSGELLNHIGYLLNCMGWVINCEVYSNAKVPVIKLQIDTSIPYMQIKGSGKYYNNNGQFFLQTEIEKIVKVDITVNVQGISSAGYDSTLLMKKWLEKYPFGQKIIILFKHILSYKHLNDNYRGGIGSYCLFVMIMAYIHQYTKDNQIQLSKLFIQILLWYSKQFNSDKQMVWLREDGPCFINQQDYQKIHGETEQRRGLLRLIDPTTKRIMSGSCSQYIKIKAFFKEILQQFISIEEMVQQQLNSSSENNLQLVKTFQNKKQSQKWFKNTNQKHGWALKNLLGMKD